MTTIHEKTVQEPCQKQEGSKFRWAVEFLAGPGGYVEKTEVVSDWFPNIKDAKEDAQLRAQQEVDDYPYSRHRILKLLVEDDKGVITELSNAKHIILR